MDGLRRHADECLQPTVQVTEEEWERVFNVNVRGIFLANKELMPRLIQQGQGGSMINISSTGASRPRPGLVWYNASKGAVSNVGLRFPFYLLYISKHLLSIRQPKASRPNTVRTISASTPFVPFYQEQAFSLCSPGWRILLRTGLNFLEMCRWGG